MAGTGYGTGMGTGTGHQTGMLHPGGVSNVTQAPAVAVGRGNTAPVAETTTTRGAHSHDQHDMHEETEETVVAGGGKRGRAGKAVNGMARTILALLQILTFLAFLAVLGGLAALQHRANNLSLTQLQQTGYSSVFTAGGQVPYPGSAGDQFAFQWYILAVEIAVTLLILMMICTPIRFLLRLKPFAMCLLTYAFVLTTLQVQSLLFFKRSPIARQLYGHSRIVWTLAGAIAGAALNGLSLLFLSLLREPHREDTTIATGRRGKRVGHDHTGHDSEFKQQQTGPAMV